MAFMTPIVEIVSDVASPEPNMYTVLFRLNDNRLALVPNNRVNRFIRQYNKFAGKYRDIYLVHKQYPNGKYCLAQGHGFFMKGPELDPPIISTILYGHYTENDDEEQLKNESLGEIGEYYYDSASSK